MTEDEIKLLKQLRLHEGVRDHAYQDSLGYWTIGVGRLIDKRKGGGLSDEEIDYLLINDVKNKVRDLDKHLPWWRDLDPIRQRVMIDMAFNLGIAGLKGFKNTLKNIQTGNYKAAKTGMLKSLWAKQVKGRAVRLANMMETGKDYE